MVSLSTGMCEDAIPIQRLVSLILRKPVPMRAREDNSAAILAAKKGYSPSLRHLPRTQRICLGSVHEMFYEDAQDSSCGSLELVYHDTKTHKADVFTKDMGPKDFRERLSLMRVGRRTTAAPSGACGPMGGSD